MISVEQAQATILSDLRAIDEVERIPLQDALGRVLAQDQHSRLNVPPADNSAMDGYALNTQSLKPEGENWLPLSQRIPAGHAPSPLAANTAARIFTGSEIPAGANAVVMQEKCREEDGQVCVPEDIASGNNIRPKGQDIAEGDLVLPIGKRLKPQDLGLLASIGCSHVDVVKRIKVAFLSTGDELVEPGDALAAGQIYNSNRFTLKGLIEAMGFESVDLGLVKDTREDTERALKQAASLADCVITSGGVSVGEEDHVKPAVEALGELNVWKIAIKPGKPLAFGHVQGTPFFGLPGNPVSVLVTFAIMVRPYLQALQGQASEPLRHLPLQAKFSSKANPLRQEYMRVKIDAEGKLDSYRTQSSGALSSTGWADAFAVIPPQTEVKPGDTLNTLLFSDLLN